MSTRVGLVFGGRSVEHEVSVQSAREVARAMQETDLECVPLAVRRDGRWLGSQHSRELLESEVVAIEAKAERGPTVAIEPGSGELVCIDRAGQTSRLQVDVVFPLIHGWGGEDGRLQGALELAGIPYVGAGVLASAAGMDKVVARRLFEARGLPVCRWRSLAAADFRSDPVRQTEQLVQDLGLPVFVKPSNGGSSVGISRVERPEQLRGAIELALEHDAEVVVEVGLDAREIECAVLGNGRPEASGLGEIVPSREFYDYAAKYLDGTSELRIPAELDAATTEHIRGMACDAFRALGLRGFARVDFLRDRRAGTTYLNEVNTLPGFTSISMFPKLWEAQGVPFPRLIETLVALALEAPR